ncbi:MAG: AMP-binding protein [Gammaproteobacteria bacterium]
MDDSTRAASFTLHAPEDPVAWLGREPVTFAALLAHALDAAKHLPEGEFAINLCEDRYRFTVGLLAALLCKQTNLLPPARVPRVVEDIARRYHGSYCLTDKPCGDLTLAQHVLTPAPAPVEIAPSAIPIISGEHTAIIAFTSGSTGIPRANAKSWGSLVTHAHLAQRQFDIGPLHTVVATVPPQHMYGLETSVMLPLVCRVAVHTGRPFFPDDIRATLEHVPAPRILVTSPVHLRVCLESGLEWPTVDFIISATAPLSGEMAAKAERIFDARVLEIYGCTEAGSLASRRTVDGNVWRLYDGFKLAQRGEHCYANASHLSQAARLNDAIEILCPKTFRLHGRTGDQVNVAGKRASLADLNHQLCAIDGVDDGVFFALEAGSDVQRLAALIVSGTLDTPQVMTELAKRLDPAFLPRPLRKVDALPRNETGKLTRERLFSLLCDTDTSALS